MGETRKIFSNAELVRAFAQGLRAGKVRGRTEAIKVFRDELRKKNENSKVAIRKALKTRKR
jgi:hypothetical protein